MSGTPEKYTFGGTFKFTGFQPLGITLKSNVLYMEDNFYLEQTELLLSAAPLECMKISPAFLLKQHLRDSAPEMFGELWTVVTLRKGTASQLRIKYPIQRNHFGEGLQFDCKVSFIF